MRKIFGCMPKHPVICAARHVPRCRNINKAAPRSVPLVNASPSGTIIVRLMMSKANQFAAGISGSETLILMIRASDSPNSIALVACAYAKFFALTRHTP